MNEEIAKGQYYSYSNAVEQVLLEKMKAGSSKQSMFPDRGFNHNKISKDKRRCKSGNPTRIRLSRHGYAMELRLFWMIALLWSLLTLHPSTTAFSLGISALQNGQITPPL